MKDKNLAKFKRLMKAGLERKQIIEKMGISPRTYYYLKKRAQQDGRRCEIAPRKYYAAVMDGYRNKDELAAKLGVSKPTLIRFEKSNRTVHRLCRATYVQGGAAYLSKIYHIPPETVKEYTAGITTLAGIQRELKTMIGIIEESAEYDPDANTTIRTILQVLDLLNTCKSKIILSRKCPSNVSPIN